MASTDHYNQPKREIAVEHDQTDLNYAKIFAPNQLEAFEKLEQEKQRLVYYTTADTALKVIRNRELWFRNVTVMNDYSEVSYGLNLIRTELTRPEGARFKEAVDDIFKGTFDSLDALSSSWIPDWLLETYIACVSLHKANEDEMGRLSMWRAYGNIALVLNNTPMLEGREQLGVYSLPVNYFNQSDFSRFLSGVTDRILIDRSYLKKLGKDKLVSYLNDVLLHIAIATKHPGFIEEQEWRIYYRPNSRLSPAMTRATEVIAGTPQTVYKLRLGHEPRNGLFHADIKSLLDRVIIGPTEFPHVTKNAFIDLLDELNVPNSKSKVVVSDIPLRVR